MSCPAKIQLGITMIVRLQNLFKGYGLCPYLIREVSPLAMSEAATSTTTIRVYVSHVGFIGLPMGPTQILWP